MRIPSKYNGAIIIDKPVGHTSHDVVARLRGILKTRSIGHTGTLDPFATGVLVMLVGKATRLARYLDKDRKAYESIVKFGYETDTGDREGTRRGLGDGETGGLGDAGTRGHGDGERATDLPSNDELMLRVNEVIPEFTGEIEQIPPMFSAKKIKGKKLYELARAGIEVERKPINISIYELEAEAGGSCEGEVLLRINCSAGTYIRTLAEDIGRRVGIPCHLSELRRIRAGRFEIKDARTLEDLESLAEEDRIEDAVVSMCDAVGHLPHQQLDENESILISRGMKIDARTVSESVQNIRLTNLAGELAAIGEIDEAGKIQPRIVLISE